ncbi:MAG: FAD-dependent oxidoreductase, partial [Siphonobacter aquaeclarae]|nr:FAD-dependent oxidoreductase [Siphonobacter aquaeclarae]
EKGVRIRLGEEVLGVETDERRLIRRVSTKTALYEADVVVAGADYHHVEDRLLHPDHRNYPESYWEKRTLAPSSLLYYLGVNRRVDRLLHHNLFFDEDFGKHSHEIYTDPRWPEKPLFYVSAPSKTDLSVAPEGCENLFILIPVAPGLDDDTPERREHYFQLVLDRLEKYVGHAIRPHIVYKRTYAHSDFIYDYHAYKGNAYGLANTLRQTALLKPSLKNRHVRNLFYTGQLTVPGPGVPPSLISGLVVAEEVRKEFAP